MIKSNYPFTERSTRILAGNLLLPKGCVLGCLLYPTVTSVVNYAWVSRIYGDINKSEGYFEVSDDTGNSLCTIIFHIPPDSHDGVFVGQAVEADGTPCGSTTITSVLVPFFYSNYALPAASLTFAPSAIRPIKASQKSQTGALKYKEHKLIGVSGDGSTIKVSESGMLNISTEPDLQKREDSFIKRISVAANSKPVGDIEGLKHIVLSSDGGGVRVHRDGATLTIGRLCDL